MIRAWSTRHGSRLSELFTQEAKHSHNSESLRKTVNHTKTNKAYPVRNERDHSQEQIGPETTRVVIDLLVTQKGNAISKQKKGLV
jgi:hypothetical protein